MENFNIIILIIGVLISLSAIKDKLKVPHPVLLVSAGLVIGFLPVPDLHIDPEIILIAFIPPLLYDAAFRTSWRDFKINIRPISALGISLVLFTIVIVAFTAYHFIPGFSWPLAFLLGAIVSPPDATAAAGIIKDLGLKKQVVSILEGESLVNDASALIAYRYALAASITSGFVIWKAGLQFLLVAGGGVLTGLIVGAFLIFLHKKIYNNTVVETSLTLLTPFLSYILAEWLHLSGILAVVTTGLMVSWRSQEIFSYQTRMRTEAVWDTLTFLLNGFLFILIGLQLPFILKQLTEYSFSTLIGYGLLVSLATILARMLWVFSGAYGVKLFAGKKKDGEGDLSGKEAGNVWKNVLIVSWTGTRGIISMATALALPLTLQDGKDFPQRHLILFVCFVVIIVTLVVQGLSLPLLIRILGVRSAENDDKEERELQLFVVNRTLYFIDHIFYPEPDNKIAVELKLKYEKLVRSLNREISVHVSNETSIEQLPVRSLTEMQKAQIAIGRFQRELLLDLHKEGRFSDAAIRQVERDMDIDDLQFEQSLPKEA